MGVSIGIDLGTTNSAAAMVYDDGPHVIPRGRGELIPSVVRFKRGDDLTDVIVGSDADRFDGRGIVRSVKRLMGRTYQSAMEESAQRYFRDIRIERRFHNDLSIRLWDAEEQPNHLWPHDVSANILTAVKTHAEQHLEAPVDKAVITVPAYFQDPHRAATLKAAELAGIDVWEPLLDEPTAAALAFGRAVGLSIDDPLLVVDWGGGTFDVSVLVNHDRDWIQLGIGGDLNLGGDDVDAEVMRLALEQKGLSNDLLEDPTIADTLRGYARGVKHRLSEKDEATISCLLPDPLMGASEPFQVEIRRSDLEDRVRPLVDKGLATIGPCLAAAGLSVDEVKKVLLVGGSTRIPLFRRCVQELLPRAVLHDEVDPMHAVALGAAIYASQERPDIARLCPYGYAIRHNEQLLEVIPPDMEVPTPLDVPFRLDRPLRTTYDEQTVYRVQLYRFTRHQNLRNVSGPSFERIYATGMPPSRAGSEVGLELRLDENKVLHARIFPPGDAPPHDVEASLGEIGERAVLTALKDRSLETEALLEANRGSPAAVFERLRSARDRAAHALEDSDFEACEELVPELDDGLEMAKTSNVPAPAKDRVLGWVGFYERNLLPTFWNAMEPERREDIVKRIRAVRILSETTAPDEELQAALIEVEQEAFHGDFGLVLRAYREAHVHGVPASISEKIANLAIEAARARLAGQMERYQRLRSELSAKLEEAELRLREWFERGDVRFASPDLRVDDSRPGGAR